MLLHPPQWQGVWSAAGAVGLAAAGLTKRVAPVSGEGRGGEGRGGEGRGGEGRRGEGRGEEREGRGALSFTLLPCYPARRHTKCTRAISSVHAVPVAWV